jgi:hypothetical protein
MAIRFFLAICGSACLLASGVAFAQQAGSTSGPAAGTNVEPSTAIQKENSGAMGAKEKDKGASSTAAGAPGVEAHPGAEGGRAPQRKTGN